MQTISLIDTHTNTLGKLFAPNVLKFHVGGASTMHYDYEMMIWLIPQKIHI